MLDVLFGTASWSDESLVRGAARCRFVVVILSLCYGRKAAIAVVKQVCSSWCSSWEPRRDVSNSLPVEGGGVGQNG